MSMYKLVILVDRLPNQSLFEKLWPEFLHEAEAMPALRRETTSWTAGQIYGEYQAELIHELYFDTREDLEKAMESPAGQAAGRTLQHPPHRRPPVCSARRKISGLKWAQELWMSRNQRLG